MRCDSRLKYAEFLSHDARFQIILPRKHQVTKLIVKYFHEEGNHASGTNQTLAVLSTRFWIISGREEIREWEKECNECRRRKAKAAKQIMELKQSWKMIYMNGTARRSLMNFGDNVINIDLDFSYLY